MSISRVTKLLAWGLGGLALLALATWLYLDIAEQENTGYQPSASIDSGVALFKENKFRQAIEVFENVEPGHPQEWYSLYYLGSSYIMLKDYAAAVEHLGMALNLNPTETQVMHALGVAYFKMGNLKMSKAYFAAVLEIDPGDAEAKGLLDIMTNLEKQQASAGQTETRSEPPEQPEPQ